MKRIIDTQTILDALDLQLAIKLLLISARVDNNAVSKHAFDPQNVNINVRKAQLQAETLTDGSVVYNIILN